MLTSAKHHSRRLASFAGEKVPLSIYRRLAARPALGFFYHTVSTDPLPHIRHLYSYKTPAMFESDVRFLKQNYELLPICELLSGNHLHESRNGAFLSFDDGLAECHSVVRPILLRHGLPCIFFIMTDYIDNKVLMYRHKISLCIDALLQMADADRAQKITEILGLLALPAETVEVFFNRLKKLGFFNQSKIDRICEIVEVDVQSFLRIQQPYMRSDQVKQLARDGFTIGAHTKSHPFLGDLSPAEVEEQIVESCRTVSSFTGDKTVPFAFPFSGKNLDRTFLASLRAKHTVIGPMFDTRGLALDQPFIFNRLAADQPSVAQANDSNLPSLLRKEYCSYLMKFWR